MGIKIESLVLMLLIASFAIDNSSGIGHPVTDNVFSYIVSIWNRDVAACSGSIIDDRHIVTAAHCLYCARAADLKIMAGRTTFVFSDPTIVWLTVNDYWIHPHYSRIRYVDRPDIDNLDNDIAVLELTTSIIWSRDLKPAPLASVDVFMFHPHCQSLGWDYRVIDEEKIMTMVWHPVVIPDQRVCSELDVKLEPNQFCAGDPFFTHTAGYGDSGSLLICNDVAIGMLLQTDIVELGFPQRPNTYLELYPYLSFIYDTTLRNH